MSRIVIASAVVVTVIAVATLAWVLFDARSSAPGTQASASVEPDGRQADAWRGEAVREDLPAPPVPELHAPVARVPAAPVPDGADDSEDGPGEAAAASVSEIDFQALVDSLSLQQELALHDAMMRHERALVAERKKYRLPADLTLVRAQLNLTREQEREIAAVKDDLKPRIDEAMAAIQPEMDGWERRHRDHWGGKSIQEQRKAEFQAKLQELLRERGELEMRKRQLQEQIDEEYLSRVRKVLTAEQAQKLDNTLKPTANPPGAAPRVGTDAG